MLPRRLTDIEWLIFPVNVPRQYRYFRHFKTLWDGKLWVIGVIRPRCAWSCEPVKGFDTEPSSWKPTAPGDKADYWLTWLWHLPTTNWLACDQGDSTYCAECRTEGALRAEVPEENNRIKKETEGNVDMIDDSSTQLEQRGRTAFFHFRSWRFRASLLSSSTIQYHRFNPDSVNENNN